MTTGGHKRIPSREGGIEIVVEELSTRMVKKGQFDEFLNKYETIFEYPDENNAADEVRNYIDEISSIVEQYI